jgi:hypothetical protein
MLTALFKQQHMGSKKLIGVFTTTEIATPILKDLNAKNEWRGIEFILEQLDLPDNLTKVIVTTWRSNRSTTVDELFIRISANEDDALAAIDEGEKFLPFFKTTTTEFFKRLNGTYVVEDINVNDIRSFSN